MSAHQGACAQSVELEPMPLFLNGEAPHALEGRVGLVVDRTDGAARLRQGALENLEPGTDAEGRLILALERTAAPDWLAGMTELQPVAPSAFTDLIVNLIEGLAGSTADISVQDGSAALESILLLARTAHNRPMDAATAPELGGDPDMLAAARLIEARLLDPALDATDLMRTLRLSRSSLYRAFRSVGGVNAYIRRRRLEHARDVLVQRTGPRPTVGEVAQSHGFASDSHFSRAFRKAFGRPPGTRRDDPSSGGA